jgi:hypothetical protein
MKLLKAFAALAILSLAMQSCCEPEFRNSKPKVLFDTYRDSMVFDKLPAAIADHVTDSAFYPIYEFSVKNEGSEADTFEMTIGTGGLGFRMRQFALPGEIVTFRTPGPLADTANPNAQDLYFTFFRRDTNDLHIQELQPFLSIKYGEVFKGDEGCNTPASELEIDPRLFR